MDVDTLKALQGSITKWEGIVAGTLKNEGPDNCPLCQKFFKPYGSAMACIGCPVMKQTGHPFCVKTPYRKYEEEEAWAINPNSETLNTLALQELDFLKSLLPKENGS
jgi:hypothetical protein